MNTVSGLDSLLQQVPKLYHSFSHTEWVELHPEGKWSRLQILGHLCDSAINNLSRFIRIQHESQPLDLTSYNQNQWVDAQNYSSADPDEILNLWVSLNQSVIRVISTLAPLQLSLVYLLPQGGTVTLEWLIEDYLEHMKQHLGQIFPDFDFL
ncbi:DinB family protein [Paenibacillus wynnii]|uniref:Metal-dependent hydrolase n=1 Tax=Paenibacillus wynnii TaxID=268407 RepID=A0A098MCG0_9BACL|nr:DinB family protein [Paenibacillus wynnii]KGE20235.1 metal-dependent hydrolase [Paenibacillus wynnii]